MCLTPLIDLSCLIFPGGKNGIKKTKLSQVLTFDISFLVYLNLSLFFPSSLPLPSRNSLKERRWSRKKGTKMKASRSLKLSTRPTASGKAALGSLTRRSSWCT